MGREAAAVQIGAGAIMACPLSLFVVRKRNSSSSYEHDPNGKQQHSQDHATLRPAGPMYKCPERRFASSLVCLLSVCVAPGAPLGRRGACAGVWESLGLACMRGGVASPCVCCRAVAEGGAGVGHTRALWCKE
jgi:hypothetical protein